MPDGLAAIVVAADLQGLESVPGVVCLLAQLLGEVTPQLLIEEVFPFGVAGHSGKMRSRTPAL
jgi:hypothetical protein